MIPSCFPTRLSTEHPTLGDCSNASCVQCFFTSRPVQSPTLLRRSKNRGVIPWACLSDGPQLPKRTLNRQLRLLPRKDIESNGHGPKIRSTIAREGATANLSRSNSQMVTQFMRQTES